MSVPKSFAPFKVETFFSAMAIRVKLKPSAQNIMRKY